MNRFIPAILLALHASALTAQSKLGKPVVDTVGKRIVRVTNSGPTSWVDTNGWKLVYERTVQPKDGDPGELVRPDNAVLFDDGRLLTTDSKPARVRLYDASGKYVRTLGRVGAGPGEYQVPFIGVHHDTVVIHDPAQSRTSLITLSGQFVRQFPSVCCNYAPISVDSRGRIRVSTSKAVNGNVESAWIFFDWLGNRIDSTWVPRALAGSGWIYRTTTANGSGTTTYRVPLGGENVQLALRDGSTLFGGTTQYELFVTQRTTDTVRIFGRRDLMPRQAPRQLRDSLFHALVDKNERARSVASFGDVPTTFPPWDELFEDGAGNIWIMRNKVYENAPRFDVFAPNGTLLGEIAVPFGKARILAWSRDHVAVSDLDQNDLPRIRIFRIEHRGH